MEHIQELLASVSGSAAFTLGFAKPIVDLLRVAFPCLSRRYIPLLTVAVSLAIMLLCMVASGQQITPALLAQSGLASLVTTTGTVGINHLHSKAERAEPRRRKVDEQHPKPGEQEANPIDTPQDAPLPASAVNS
jgi:hypothetical protein